MSRVFCLVGYTCCLDLIHGQLDGHNPILLVLALVLTTLNVLGVVLP